MFNISLRTGIFLLLSIIVLLATTYFDSVHYRAHLKSAIHILTYQMLWGIFIYMLVTENLVFLFITLRRDLGGNYFRNIVNNTYRNSKEEMRIFMFLDMQDSTPLAYKLGSLDFNRYVQDKPYQ